jgi:hypothetical protein
MVLNLYLRDGQVYLPTMAQTEAGFFLDVEPVETVPVDDGEALREAIVHAMSRGNPKIATPSRTSFRKPVILKYAKVKSWSEFERNCSNWAVEEQNGHFQIRQAKKRLDRGWEDDPALVEVLPSNSSFKDVAVRLVSRMQSSLAND